MSYKKYHSDGHCQFSGGELFRFKSNLGFDEIKREIETRSFGINAAKDIPRVF